MYSEIKKCRICANKNLLHILSLGEQSLAGVFPKEKDAEVTEGPLDLVWCGDCGLLQLRQSYSLGEMYGGNYGYRSGLNPSMVRHLQHKMNVLESIVDSLSESDIVIDIGSNDATSLRSYKSPCMKVGIDPTGQKFAEYYPENIQLIPDFFSAKKFEALFSGRKAKIITSIAMFYDLESPLDFVRDIAHILHKDGIWHFEQSYLVSMLRTNAYDTICHEHLEFYSLRVVKELLEKCGLRIVDVQMNGVNGGSFAVTACHEDAAYRSNLPIIQWMLNQEFGMGLDTPVPYRDFETRIFQHRKSLIGLIQGLVNDGKKVFGYGASTKGNVLLQFCGLTEKEIPFIVDVNADKFGAYTPGTHIPIISEAEGRTMKPDYFLVLPWHFKSFILEKEKSFLLNGGKFIFPMPDIEII